MSLFPPKQEIVTIGQLHPIQGLNYLLNPIKLQKTTNNVESLLKSKAKDLKSQLKTQQKLKN